VAKHGRIGNEAVLLIQISSNLIALLLTEHPVENHQFSDVAAKMAGTQTSVNSTSIQNSIFDQSERLRSMVSVVGRAGFLATPNLLVYGLGGLALGHFKYPDGGDRFPDPNGKWVAGYTVGAGGELKVARHWSLRTEYRYLHFDIERGASYDTFTTAGGPTTFSFASRTSTDFHLGKVGLVYRIGGDSPSAMAAMPGSAETCCDRWTGFSAGIYGAGGAGRQAPRRPRRDGGLVQLPVVVGHRASASEGGRPDLLRGRLLYGVADEADRDGHRVPVFLEPRHLLTEHTGNGAGDGARREGDRGPLASAHEGSADVAGPGCVFGCHGVFPRSGAVFVGFW
jgi:hypothetical protein